MTVEGRQFTTDLIRGLTLIACASFFSAPKWAIVLVAVLGGYGLCSALTDYKSALEKKLDELQGG